MSATSLAAAGQAFTFRATARNQGDTQAAATTLRYYHSGDSTTSTSDMPVGTNAASGPERHGYECRIDFADGTDKCGSLLELIS